MNRIPHPALGRENGVFLGEENRLSGQLNPKGGCGKTDWKITESRGRDLGLYAALKVCLNKQMNKKKIN